MLYDLLTALKIMPELRWMMELSTIDTEMGSIFSTAKESSNMFECILLQVRYSRPMAPVA